MPTLSQFGALRVRPFRLLWIGQTTSALGDALVPVALAFAVLDLTGAARLWQLVLLAAVYGAGQAFFQPASTGLVPATVPPERLQQANALLGLSRSERRRRSHRSCEPPAREI